MPTLKAEFDGRVFVPSVTVDLPVGTKVEVLIPPNAGELSAEEWQELLREIEGGEPPFPSVDEALRYTRKRP